MFMMLASIASSIFSIGMMGYLSMSTELGPWIAPIFIVVVMVFIRSFLYEKTASKYVIAIVTSSSLGGMIGICLGLSFPAFFFMHQKIFKIWLASPVKFSLVVAAFIATAAIYAFLVGYILHHYFLVAANRKFPMSRLVYDVLYNDNPGQVKFLTAVGVALSFIINRVIVFTNVLSTTSLIQFSMYPLLVSIGFISGQMIAVPVLIGLITRVFVFRLIHTYIPSNMTDRSLVITFCIGMMIAWFVLNLSVMFIEKSSKYWKTHSFLLMTMRKTWFWVWLFLAISTNFLLLWYSGVSIFVVLAILMMLMLLALYSVDVLSMIGIVDVSTYVLFVLLGMIYFVSAGMVTMIAVSVLATLCIGIVIDLIFSYKLASLANVDYKFVTKYQIISILTSIFCAGIIFWYFCSSFNIQSYSALAGKTYQFENMVKYAEYNPKIMFAGFFYGVMLYYLLGDLLAIVGSVLMEPAVSTVIVISGAFANMIKNREKIYPAFLGIYAGHMLWLLLGMFK
jgi:hypothetical protein